MMQLLLMLTYITIIVMLVWARFKYFKIDTHTSRASALLYDPVVTLHIGATFYEYLVYQEHSLYFELIAFVLYILGGTVFILSISKTPELDFAFSDKTRKLITTGTYSIIRHPLYASYSLIWLSSTLLFHSMLLSITLIYLATFYVVSAIREEKVIKNSAYSREYEDYCQDVGMFLPRIKEWKS